MVPNKMGFVLTKVVYVNAIARKKSVVAQQENAGSEEMPGEEIRRIKTKLSDQSSSRATRRSSTEIQGR